MRSLPYCDCCSRGRTSYNPLGISPLPFSPDQKEFWAQHVCHSKTFLQDTIYRFQQVFVWPSTDVSFTTQTAEGPLMASRMSATSDHQWRALLLLERASSFSRSGPPTIAHHHGLIGSKFQTGNLSIKLQKWSCKVWSWLKQLSHNIKRVS